MSDKNYHSLGLFLCVHVRAHVCHGEGGEVSQLELLAVFCSIVQGFDSQENV